MLIATCLTIAVFVLAYANGANDNFKGVATLFGSRTTSYRTALWWATFTTFAGSCAAVMVSAGLLKAFSGKGLVPDALTDHPAFLLAVGLGAAITVLIATRTGLPVSTTHALVGALVGAGVIAAGSVRFDRIAYMFVLPLAVSPLLSYVLTTAVYPVLRFLRVHSGVERQMCVCIDGQEPQPISVHHDGTAVLQHTGTALTVGQLSACEERYYGRVIGIDAQVLLDKLHFVSAGAVSFARGLNDAPKIAALLLASAGLGMQVSVSMLMVGVAMAIGGLLQARRVARTMSQRITTMNHGQGLTANLITALLVTLASRSGVPVSTTHVSCGSLFGLGATNGSARWSVIRNIVLSWMLTLPVAAIFAAICYVVFG